MNVGLGLLGWLHLDDQVDVRNIEAPGSYVSGNKNAELVLLEPLQCHLSLTLGNVSVHDLDVLAYFLRQEEGVGLCLG